MLLGWVQIGRVSLLFCNLITSGTFDVIIRFKGQKRIVIKGQMAIGGGLARTNSVFSPRRRIRCCGRHTLVHNRACKLVIIFGLEFAYISLLLGVCSRIVESSCLIELAHYVCKYLFALNGYSRKYIFVPNSYTTKLIIKI